MVPAATPKSVAIHDPTRAASAAAAVEKVFEG